MIRRNEKQSIRNCRNLLVSRSLGDSPAPTVHRNQALASTIQSPITEGPRLLSLRQSMVAAGQRTTPQEPWLTWPTTARYVLTRLVAILPTMLLSLWQAFSRR